MWSTTDQLIELLPKTELHLHIEGTLEPEMMLQMAEKNKVRLPYDSVESLQAAYQFENLQSFLDLYYQGCKVLQTEEDFYDLTWAYLEKAANNNIRHVEIFFDPQTHTERGVAMETIIGGLSQALKEGKAILNLSNELILCFLRHLSEEAAMQTLVEALPFRDYFVGVGLDSAEVGHPPEKFKQVFEEAQKNDLLTFAHAGEEGPASYIWQALELLKVTRIDHGVRCMDDTALITELKTKQIPLTVCPLSNIKLKVFDKMENHPIKRMLSLGLCATINSDDPAYFGGYLNKNYEAVAHALELSTDEIATLAKNSFKASLLDEGFQKLYMSEIDRVIEEDRENP